MIISASRRTDIPAFYTGWFMNRIRDGTCSVPNPFNPGQVSHVSLEPEDVDVIVFWTRHARPLLPYLKELDTRGYRYYFLYTLMNNPRKLDPRTPPFQTSLDAFRELADRVGPEKVIWRYDPIVFTNVTGPDFHLKNYERIARDLKSYTFRSVISFVDMYRKAKRRFQELQKEGIRLLNPSGEELDDFVRTLVSVAHGRGMDILSCSEKRDLLPYGIRAGKCVDDEYIATIFGLEVTGRKDPSQRKACGCVVSKDIGMYESCLYGCIYCYATTNFERSKTNYEAHDSTHPSLIR